MIPAVSYCFIFFFQAEDGIRDKLVTGVQTCALPISPVPQPIGGGRHRSAVPDGLGPDRPHPPCAAGRPGRVRGAVSPPRGSGVRALPASHERPGAGRGAVAGRVRAGLAAPRELPRRKRVRVVALPADGERGVSSPPRGTRSERPPGGEGESGRPAVALDLERAVAGLPPGARQVFVLHDVEGYRHEEIARLTGVAVGTSKAQLFRARRLLREALNR